MIAALKKALPESKDNYETVQKQYTSKANIDIEVNGLNDSAPTAEIKVSFLQTEGWNHNTLYYYVYEEGEEPTKSDLDKFINKKYRIYGPVWTADNQIENEGEAGYTVTLKNPNRADGNFENGDCIGFILKSNPYDNLSHSDYFYTRNIDYPENFSQAARFAYNNKALVYTFEDQPIYKNGFNRPREKADYNDFSFIVQSTPIEAIDDPEIPDLPTPPFYLEEKGAPYTGTLLFEDMYPSQGDYDMNDVIVEYNLVPCTHILYDPELDTTTPPYYLSSIDYTFTPVWDGADYGASFSFMIDNINIDNTATKKTVENIFSIPANEEKGELNMGSYEGSVDFGFVIEKIPNGNNQYEEVYESGGVNLGEEPKFSWANCFNPFITVDYTGYEVHLSKKAPSDNAKEDGLDEWALNYVYKDSKFPYAMNIPITDYQVVTEKERIDSFYPTYVQWVESEGQEATDWYIKK